MKFENFFNFFQETLANRVWSFPFEHWKEKKNPRKNKILFHDKTQKFHLACRNLSNLLQTPIHSERSKFRANLTFDSTNKAKLFQRWKKIKIHTRGRRSDETRYTENFARIPNCRDINPASLYRCVSLWGRCCVSTIERFERWIKLWISLITNPDTSLGEKSAVCVGVAVCARRQNRYLEGERPIGDFFRDTNKTGGTCTRVERRRTVTVSPILINIPRIY